MASSPITCPNCGSENAPGRRFCGECGRPLSVICPVCGTANDPVKFCGQCGSPLTGAVAVPASEPAPAASERRLVSVLFADLVGFTSLSEARDPDEVRELLSRYFESCRTLISRYGGTVEKFIGDAVMAVWGTPVAQEDDAERAVRTALDLVAAVGALGAETGMAGLQARAGVLTGEAAVTLGASAEGMVAGDLVNTASRIQATASPGQVFVGERTRRATEASIVYDDAGEHELKGKAEPVHLHRAVRVIGGLAGAQRSEGLESPFVGRDGELRQVKELFHAAAEGAKAHMVSVIGIAGIGKSRLSWEFFKYIDGLAGVIRWHRGRCLAYGEGVTYWALAEMVRGRAGIVEGEDPSSARAKLHASVEEFIADPEERTWIEARLAHLLALEERTAREPEDLFGAWRRFFERMAEGNPVVLVFEDLQWADPALLDFIEYLLNWSRTHPIFVMALARPDITERSPQWAAARRGVSTMYLEPLERGDMETLIDGMVPGLPAGIREQILDRAEGIPLYAMETVRMLLDRGLLVQEESAYRLTGPVEDLAVPETLHALIAARLDGLPAEERSLLQEAAVIGKTFSAASLAAVGGHDLPGVERMLQSLVRKEVLGIQADPRSPERGQYVFLQDLVRRVAYETLSRRDRKARHLAVAAQLEHRFAGEEVEIAEVLASHYLDAFEAAPDADDAPAIKVRARDALVRAATRSESLAARRAALGYFERAAQLTDDPAERMDLYYRAGLMANDGGQVDRAREVFDEAIAIARTLEDEVAEARIELERGFMSTADGRIEESYERVSRAYAVLSRHEPGPDLAKAGAEKSRLAYFLARSDEAWEPIEVALAIAERLMLPDVLSHALNTKALLLKRRGRIQECLGLLRHALRVALEHEANTAALRAYNNLVATIENECRWSESLALLDEGLVLSRRLGVTGWENKFLADRVPQLVIVGRWDDAFAANEEAIRDAETASLFAMAIERIVLALPLAARGRFAEAEEALAADVMEASDDVQAVSQLSTMRALVRHLEGRFEEVIAAAEQAWTTIDALGWSVAQEMVSGLAVDSALALGDLARATELLARTEAVPPGEVSPYGRATLARARAKVAAASGETQGVGARFEEAVAGLRGVEMPYDLALALTDHGEWLLATGRAEEAAKPLAEAREIFEGLGATVLLDRLDALSVAARGVEALADPAPA
jgi:class 3 adenylate cyclase/tetratricopeptide (TPR) repeat protein